MPGYYTRKQIEKATRIIASITDDAGVPLYEHVWCDPHTVYWKIFMKNAVGIAVSEFLRDPQEKLWMWDSCNPQDITSTDLRDILQDYRTFRAFKVMILGETEQAEGIYSATLGRMGIAWGADASFATIHYTTSVEKSIEEGIEMYLNRPEEWEIRN